MTGIALATTLRAQGHRVTRPREAVWSALTAAGGHVTADEVADCVARADQRVDRASVYRSLRLFAQLGLARESRLGETDAARWEVAHPDEHFHLVCEGCGAVDHHVGEIVETVRAHLRGGHGFVADQVELTVTGRCADCADGAG